MNKSHYGAIRLDAPREAGRARGRRARLVVTATIVGLCGVVAFVAASRQVRSKSSPDEGCDGTPPAGLVACRTPAARVPSFSVSLAGSRVTPLPLLRVHIAN